MRIWLLFFIFLSMMPLAFATELIIEDSNGDMVQNANIWKYDAAAETFTYVARANSIDPAKQETYLLDDEQTPGYDYVATYYEFRPDVNAYIYIQSIWCWNA